MMSERRIGLLSLQWMNNYGTIIQAYALQKAIWKLGFQSEYISYRPNQEKNKVNPVKQFFHGFPDSIFQIMPYVNNRIRFNKLNKVKEDSTLRNERFESFRQKNIRISNKIYTDSEQLLKEPPEYDIYITGSDQIWSPNLSYSCEAYMLNFVKDDHKKNAYASSLGTVNIPSNYKERLIHNLKNFSNLSCREISGAEYLKKVLEREVVEVLDPTMLLDIGDLLDVSEERIIPENKFILCYFLGNKKWHRSYAKGLSESTGFPCYYVAYDALEVGRENALWDVGPAEFISLIHRASYVCTDSFHGSVLAILFHKELYGFCKRGDLERTSDNSRLHDLYFKFGIEERLIKKACNRKQLEEIDYSVVDKILQKNRINSKLYLKKILKAI
ncbi:MAG: polysaccharide pyruvyl transferase family protein [Proteiniphilum sp.]